MSDLFSGRSALSPWIEEVVYDTILRRIRTQRQQLVAPRRPKVVQVLALGSIRDDHRVPWTLLISDGATSAVACLSQPTREALQLETDRMNRGCVIRINEWNVRVEVGQEKSRCDLLGEGDNLFRRYAMSKAASVFLQIDSAVVFLGSIGGMATIPGTIGILDKIDIRRALLTMESSRLSSTPTNNSVSDRRHFGNVANLFETAAASTTTDRRNSLSEMLLAAASSQKHNVDVGSALENDDLPIGNLAALFELPPASAAVDKNIDQAILSSTSNPTPTAVHLDPMPHGNLQALFSTITSEESASVLSEICCAAAIMGLDSVNTARRIRHHQGTTMTSFPVILTLPTMTSTTTQSLYRDDEDDMSDDEEGLDSFGIDHMLCDPTPCEDYGSKYNFMNDNDELPDILSQTPPPRGSLSNANDVETKDRCYVTMLRPNPQQNTPAEKETTALNVEPGTTGEDSDDKEFCSQQQQQLESTNDMTIRRLSAPKPSITILKTSYAANVDLEMEDCSVDNNCSEDDKKLATRQKQHTQPTCDVTVQASFAKPQKTILKNIDAANVDPTTKEDSDSNGGDEELVAQKPMNIVGDTTTEESCSKVGQETLEADFDQSLWQRQLDGPCQSSQQPREKTQSTAAVERHEDAASQQRQPPKKRAKGFRLGGDTIREWLMNNT